MNRLESMGDTKYGIGKIEEYDAEIFLKDGNYSWENKNFLNSWESQEMGLFGGEVDLSLNGSFEILYNGCSPEVLLFPGQEISVIKGLKAYLNGEYEYFGKGIELKKGKHSPKDVEKIIMVVEPWNYHDETSAKVLKFKSLLNVPILKTSKLPFNPITAEILKQGILYLAGHSSYCETPIGELEKILL